MLLISYLRSSASATIQLKKIEGLRKSPNMTFLLQSLLAHQRKSKVVMLLKKLAILMVQTSSQQTDYILFNYSVLYH